MRILIVEKDAATAHSIGLILRAQNISTDTAGYGEGGIEMARYYDYDAIVLDPQLPDMSGYDVLTLLRSARVEAPILMLSNNPAVEARVRALELGADDYLTKPFNHTELVARIRTLVRRANGHAQTIITTGKLAVNLADKTVEANNRPIHMTRKEYQVIELLSLRKGRTQSKDMFMNYLYGGIDEPQFKVIDVFLCKIRKKLAAACNGEQYIKTVWGRGHVLRDPETMESH